MKLNILKRNGYRKSLRPVIFDNRIFIALRDNILQISKFILSKKVKISYFCNFLQNEENWFAFTNIYKFTTDKAIKKLNIHWNGWGGEGEFLRKKLGPKLQTLKCTYSTGITHVLKSTIRFFLLSYIDSIQYKASKSQLVQIPQLITKMAEQESCPIPSENRHKSSTIKFRNKIRRKHI